VSDAELLGAKWRKSTASGGGDCAEVAFVAGGVLMRHSQHPSGSVLTFSPSEWTAFLAGVRNGEFDLTKPAPVAPDDSPM
jgi:uncharacterized protein DUF397